MKLICLMCLLLLTDKVACNPDYIFYRQIKGWLKIHHVPASWKDAFLTCHYEGAVLASPLNKEIAATMRKILEKTNKDIHIFLGVNALLSERDFFSVEGVPIADMPVTWTAYGERVTSVQCLTFTSRSNEVYPSSCKTWRPYMCFKKQDRDTKFNMCGTFDNDYHYVLLTGSCYKVHQDRKSWDMAHKICAAEGGYLAIINDHTEAQVIKAMIPDFESVTPRGKTPWKPVHIGLRNWHNKEGNTWLTLFGESIETVYNAWRRKQPNDGTKICGCFVEGYLDYTPCWLKTLYICEKNPWKSRYEVAEWIDPEYDIVSDIITAK